MRVFEDPSLFEDWLRIGGAQTLMSYGLAPPDLKRDDPASIMRDLIRAMPGEHLEFLDELRLSFTCGDFFFVHAGVRPGVPWPSKAKATCFGFAKSSFRVRSSSANISFMVTRRCAPPKFWQTGSTSIRAPTRRAI